MKKSDWYEREDLVSGLETALATPAVKQALELLIEEEVTAISVVHPQLDPVQQAALTGANREGFFRFYRSLKALTKKPLPKSTEAQPWAHTLKRSQP